MFLPSSRVHPALWLPWPTCHMLKCHGLSCLWTFANVICSFQVARHLLILPGLVWGLPPWRSPSSHSPGRLGGSLVWLLTVEHNCSWFESPSEWIHFCELRVCHLMSNQFAEWMLGSVVSNQDGRGRDSVVCVMVWERRSLWNGVSLFVGPRCLRGWGEAPWGLQRGRELLGVGSREAVWVSEKETFKKAELLKWLF